MFTRALAGFAGILLAAQAVGGTPAPEQRYAQAAEVLAKGCRGTGCHFGVETPDERAALNAAWAATQDWTVAWFEAHPDWSLERRRSTLLNWNVNNLNRVAPSGIFELRPGLYIVFAQIGEMGNVFLIGKRGDHFAVVWNIRQADASAFPILNAWRLEDNVTCRSREDVWTGVCGPLFGNEIVPLPPDEKGRPRFYLNATYAQAAETSVGAQLTVWVLDGMTPKVQWAKKYAYNFEDVSWNLDGSYLKIRATDWWRTFFTCGTCIGRQMDWTLHIRPDGVDDLGMKPVVPELDAVDELLFRAWKHQPLDDLAVPKVQEVMMRVAAEAAAAQEELDKKYKLPPSPDHLYTGMLWNTPKDAVEHEGRQVCFSTDDTAPMRISFIRQSDKLFATDIVEFPQNEGESCPKSTP